MVKIVDLCLDGDSENLGFTVRLTIAEEGSQADIQKSANLPASPELSTQLQDHWQEKYRTLGAPYRIKPKEITIKRSFKEQVQECNESAGKLRKNLNTWLDSEEFRLLDKELRTSLNKDDAIRFLIRTDSQELHKLPWEEWEIFKSYPKAGCSLSPTKYERIKTIRSTCNPKVRILAILGNSEGINIAPDQQLLESLPNVEIVFLVKKTRQEINDQLWDQPWDILFFAGHSETEGETGRIYINPTDSLTIDELWYGLNKAVNKGLRIAIFNSCDGLGLARQLESMNLHIPQMIVMRELVPDRVAQEFLKYFLTAFANGESFDIAVREAKERLKGMESNFPCASWLPVIWQNPTEVPPKWEELFAVPQPEIVEPEVVILRPKRNFWQRSLHKLLIASVGVTCLVMGVRSLGILQSVELQAFDQLMRSRPEEVPDSRILIVEAIEHNINNYGGYPLPDDTLAKLIKKIQSYQPLAIGLDMHRYQPREKGRKDFIAQFQQNPDLFTVCEYNSNEIIKGPPTEFSKEQLRNQVGFSNLSFDDLPGHNNNTIRRQLLSYEPKLASSYSPCNTPFSLSFQLAHRFLYKEGINSDKDPKTQDYKFGNVVLNKLANRTGGYQNLDGRLSQILINYRSIKPATTVTLEQVLSGSIDSNLVKGRIILIGTTAPVAKEDVDTPYGKMPAVWVHAHMVSQILSAVIDDNRPLLWVLPQWGELQWGDILFVWVWSFTGGLLAWCFHSRLKLMLFSGVTFWLLYKICLVIFTAGGWMPIVPSALAILITAGSLVIYTTSKKRQ